MFLWATVKYGTAALTPFQMYSGILKPKTDSARDDKLAKWQHFCEGTKPIKYNVFCFVFQDSLCAFLTVLNLLCSPTNQTGLKRRDPPASACQVLALKAFTITIQLKYNLCNKHYMSVRNFLNKLTEKLDIGLTTAIPVLFSSLRRRRKM